MHSESDTTVNRENTSDTVGTPPQQTRTEITTRPPSERQLLPGLALSEITRPELGEDGKQTTRTDLLMTTSATSSRQCDSCYIASRCPAFKPSSTCAYEIPITLKNRDQLSAARDAVMAIQLQRISFMRLVEEAEGGYADPNLTKEIELWNRMVTKRIEEESDSISITMKASARASGQAGMIARLFGSEVSESARQLEAPRSSDDIFREAGILEAEVIDG